MDEWAEEESSNVAVSISATMKSHGPQKRSFHLSVCLSPLISGHTVLSDERVNTSRVAVLLLVLLLLISDGLILLFCWQMSELIQRYR